MVRLAYNFVLFLATTCLAFPFGYSEFQAERRGLPSRELESLNKRAIEYDHVDLFSREWDPELTVREEDFLENRSFDDMPILEARKSIFNKIKDGVKGAAKKVGKEAKKDVKKVGNTVKKDAKKVGKTAKKGVKKAGKGVKKAGKAAAKGAAKAGKATMKGAEKALPAVEAVAPALSVVAPETALLGPAAELADNGLHALDKKVNKKKK